MSYPFPLVNQARRALPLLTNSSLACFRRCPREYHYRYVMLRKARHRAEALRFGSFFHIGLNAWWACAGPESPEIRLKAGLLALNERARRPEDSDPFQLVKAISLLAGYTARWSETFEVVAVEKNFRMALNERFDLGGSIDAVANFASGTFNIEHKTTSADISAGSSYWRNIITMDPQVSTYEAASRAIGHNIRGTLYDVIRKPELIPLKATPEDARKYTKPTKAEPIPRLYAGQREEDETPEQYGERVAEDIIRRPDWYYQRNTIVRLERDAEEHARDVRETAEAIQFAGSRDAWPRSPNACERYHRLCSYHPVCSGETSIEDDSLYETKSRQHEELLDA